MREQILNLKNEALAMILGAKSLEELEAYRQNYLGRKGRLNEFIKKQRN